MARGGYKKCAACPNLIRSGRYCHGCAKIHGRKRREARAQDATKEERTARRIRSTQAWTLLSRAHRADNPWCADPFGVHGNRLAPAEEVHHIVKIVHDNESAFDADNLMSVCKACHRRLDRVPDGPAVPPG